MAKVLLVDTNFSSLPIYRALSSLGHEVHVVGGNPQDCLAKISKNYWNINYANTDALGELIRKQKFEHLVPGCTDRSYESCVMVNRGEFSGIDGAEASKAISNKAAFRHLAQRLGLPVPNLQDQSRDSLRWPLVVKPVDAFSGKGITVIERQNLQQLEVAVGNAKSYSPTNEYLIEDFVEGQLYSHTAFLSKRKVIQDFIVQEDRTANQFVVDTSKVVYGPSDLLLAGLRSCVETLAAELSLADGLLHAQFISNGRDFWLIELTRRCPGDLYSQLIELTTGCKYAHYYVLPFVNERVVGGDFSVNWRHIMRHTITLKDEQSLGSVRFKVPLQIERWVPLSLVGDQLKPSPQSRVGILFCSARNDEELGHVYRRALQRELYEVLS